jgi:uncharacterized membrane protein
MAERSQLHGLAAKRLAIAVVAGAAVLVGAFTVGSSWPVAVTGAWVIAALVLVVWIWAGVHGLSAAETQVRAQSEDFSRAASDFVALSASVASLVAVGFLLIRAGNHSGIDQMLLIMLAVLAVALSWATVQTIYTLRYGHLYYGVPVGGIDFNETGGPDYHDFAYLAVTVGMTFQVSDTNLGTKAIRRTATRHALISYLFGTVIVAVAINAVASLLR